MSEGQAQRLYSSLIEANQTAVAAKLFGAAHHALAAAMYVAIYLEDSYKLLELEVLAREQLEEIALSERQVPTPLGATCLSLYQSLLQMVKTRLMLLPRRK